MKQKYEIHQSEKSKNYSKILINLAYFDFLN